MPFDNLHQNFGGDVGPLLDARDRIADPGRWVKGEFRDGDRHCLVAALSLAANSRNFLISSRAERRLARLVANEIPRTAPLGARLRVMSARQRLIRFNDWPGTRHQDVLALLDRAIDRQASKAALVV